jgi:hypothetical protein
MRSFANAMEIKATVPVMVDLSLSVAAIVVIGEMTV